MPAAVHQRLGPGELEELPDLARGHAAEERDARPARRLVEAAHGFEREIAVGHADTAFRGDPEYGRNESL